MSRTAAPPTPHAPPPVSTFTAATAFVCFVLTGAVQALYGPSIPGFSRLFGLPVGTVGLLLSVHALFAMLGVLIWIPLEGRAAERWRPALCVAGMGLGALALGWSPVWPVALLGAAVLGLGFGGTGVGLNSLFAHGFGRRGPLMVNLLNAMFGLGAILGPLVVGASAGRGARLPFLIMGGCALALLPFVLGLDDRGGRQSAAPPATPPQRRILAAFVGLMALGVGVESTNLGWAPTYLVHLGATTPQAANSAALFYVVFTVARLLAAVLSLRLSAPRMLLGALSLIAAALLLAQLRFSVPLALALVSGGVSVLFPSIFSWMSRLAPPVRGGAAAVIAGGLLGASVFQGLVGWSADHFGPGSIPAALLALVLVTLLAAAGLRLRGGPRVSS